MSARPSLQRRARPAHRDTVRRGTVRLGLAIAVVAALPATAAAQGGVGIGLAGGVNLPAAEYGDAARQGLVLNGFLELRTGGALGLRGSLFWSRSDIDNPLLDEWEGVTLPSGQDYDVRGDVDLIGASADLVLGVPSGAVRPYLVGGVGAFRRRVSQDIAGAIDEFQSLRTTDTDIGYNAGVGVRFALLGLGLFAEARYYTVDTQPERTNFIPVTVGLTF